VRAANIASAVGLSPDGLRAVVSSLEFDVQVWDLDRNECTLRLQHASNCTSACFSPDGSRVLTASRDGTAAVWDAQNGKRLHALVHEPPDREVDWADFSSDGRHILTRSAQRIRIWDSDTGRLQQEWSAHDAALHSAQFSPDGTRVVTAGKDNTARVWNTATGAPVTPPLRHRGEVLQAWFSPDNTRIVTASKDHTAKIWDARSGAALGEPLRHQGTVMSARFCPQSSRVVTASEDGTVRIWDGRTGQALSGAFTHPQRVNDAMFSPGGGQLLIACQLRFGAIWDVPTFAASAPAWLPLLAETVAGQRLNTDESIEPIPVTEFLRLKQALAHRSTTEPGGRWLAWFLADRSERTLGPESTLSVREAIKVQVELAQLGSTGTCPELAQLMVLDPDQGRLLARAARLALRAHQSGGDPQWLHRATWLSRQAVQFDPDDPAGWWIQAGCQSATDDPTAALESFAQGARLPSTTGAFWLAYAAFLESHGRDQAALQAWHQALDPGRPPPILNDTQQRRAWLAQAHLLERQGRTAEALAHRRRAYGITVPPRDPQTPAQCLDLSDFYNANLDTDWRGTRYPRHNLSTLPRNRQIFDGIEFDVRGALQLAGSASRRWDLQYPTVIPGIPVRQPVRQIHFLHATINSHSAGENNGAYTIHLENGQTEQHVLLTTVNICRWDRHPLWEYPEPIVAWEGTSPAGIPVRLFRSTWTNPHPESVVQSIDFDAPPSGLAPFLVAITVEL
jgi:tetratricopeptide (TPR) repeat protein